MYKLVSQVYKIAPGVLTEHGKSKYNFLMNYIRAPGEWMSTPHSLLLHSLYSPFNLKHLNILLTFSLLLSSQEPIP